MASRRYAAPMRFVRSLVFVALVSIACACQSNDPLDEGIIASEAPPTAKALEGPSPVEQMDQFIAYRPIDRSNPDWKLDLPKPPNVRYPRNLKIYWMLDTNAGALKIELKPKAAPRHVSTTIYLTRLGFYDGLVFHRIIPQFMAQGGDPLGTGRGGPGFTYNGEFPKRPLSHNKKGIVSAANAGPHTDGSQFFILFKENPSLDGKHTIYGQVVEGWGTMAVLERSGSQSGKPTNRIFIRRARIVERPVSDG